MNFIAFLYDKCRSKIVAHIVQLRLFNPVKSLTLPLVGCFLTNRY